VKTTKEQRDVARIRWANTTFECKDAAVSVRDLLDDIDTLEAKLKIAEEALIKEAPKWNTCEHEYEPNTTMDYFRCDNCGARPMTVEALKKMSEGLKRRTQKTPSFFLP
jgi:predicted RNA-binding Zn-ribbon protein involved in translation (DUF1610 family)